MELETNQNTTNYMGKNELENDCYNVRNKKGKEWRAEVCSLGKLIEKCDK